MIVNVFYLDDDGKHFFLTFTDVRAIFTSYSPLGELLFVLVIDSLSFFDYPRYSASSYELEIS